MKLIVKKTFSKILIIILLISYIRTISLSNKSTKLLNNNSNNAKAKANTEYNGGDWNSGFKCPEFLIDASKQTNLGGILLKAKEITENTIAINKIGFLIEFENTPSAEGLQILNKFAIQQNNKKQFYIPWRYFQSDVTYTNPTFGNKTLKGSLITDNKENFIYIIKLPYKRLGWYIGDQEGDKIKNAILKISSEEKNKIKSAKSILTEKSNEYLLAKREIKEIQKSNNDLKKLKENQKANEDKLSTECDKNTELKKEINSAKSIVNNFLHQYLILKSQVNGIEKNFNESNLKIQMLKKSIESFKKTDNNKLIDENKKNAASVILDADKQYDILRVNVPDKVSFIDKSQEGLKALNKDVYQSNLNQFSP